MGLWKRVKRLLPLGAFVAAAVFANRYCVNEVNPRITQIEQRYGNERARKKILMWFLSGSVLSLAALGAAHIVQRKKGTKPSFLQPAVEHPYWSGGIIALAYGLTAEAQVNDVVFSTYAGGSLGVLTTTVTAALSHVKPPYAINYAKNIMDVLRSFSALHNPAREQAILEHIRAYRPQPAHIDLELVDVLLRQEKVDEALDVLKRGISCLDQAITPFALERYLVRPLLHEIIFATPQRWRGRFWEFYANLRQGDLGDALAALDTFVEADKDLNHIAARAYTLQMLTDLWPALQRLLPKRNSSGQNDLAARAQTAWQETITTIFADPKREQQFTLMGESRNEVLEYAASKFLKGLFVFKRCAANDGVRLQRERKRVLDLRRQYKNHVVQSLAFLEHEGKAYHVLRHGASRTLEDVFKTGAPEDRRSALSHAATALALIHLTPQEDTRTITDGYYTQRLQTVFYDQLVKKAPRVFMPRAAREAVLQVGARVAQELKDAPRGWYKDANPRNWLVEDNHRVVAIDFEHEDQLPVQLDLVSLLEFGPAPVTETERHAALEHYLRVVSRKKQVDRQRFFQQYRFAALQRHLELAGYRARDGEFKAVEFHISRAKEYAQELGEHEFAKLLGDISVAS